MGQKHGAKAWGKSMGAGAVAAVAAAVLGVSVLEVIGLRRLR